MTTRKIVLVIEDDADVLGGYSDYESISAFTRDVAEAIEEGILVPESLELLQLSKPH